MLVKKCETLINQLIEASNYYMDYSYSVTKPVWMKQTEQFFSFYSKIKDDDGLIKNFKDKVLIEFFEENKQYIIKPVASDTGVIQDKFLIITDAGENEITINNVPKGLFLHIGKVYLPISELYTEVKKLIKKRKDNLPHLENILIALYRMCLCLTQDQDDIKQLESNVELLQESLEVRDEPPKKSSNPLDMVQNMLGNINFDQIGNLMKQVTSDEKSSKEFNDIFGKVSEGLARGDNPMDTMNHLLKSASVDLNSGPSDSGDSTGDAGGEPTEAATEQN